jgi:hypothetical protein
MCFYWSNKKSFYLFMGSVIKGFLLWGCVNQNSFGTAKLDDKLMIKLYL